MTRDALERGGGTPPPLQGAQPMPSHCPLEPSARPNGICNRKYPPPTASATPSNRLPNRLWGRLGGAFPSNATLGATPSPQTPFGESQDLIFSLNCSFSQNDEI